MTKQQPHLRKIEKGVYAVVNWRKQTTRFQVGDVLIWHSNQMIVASNSERCRKVYALYDVFGREYPWVHERELMLIKEYDQKTSPIHFGYGVKKK